MDSMTTDTTYAENCEDADDEDNDGSIWCLDNIYQFPLFNPTVLSKEPNGGMKHKFAKYQKLTGN